jgi:hypothetical protein
MAKKKSEAAKSEPKADESMAGYFRKLFAEDRKLLKERSNEKILQRWLADHPEQTEVPQSVKASLANTKSVLRSKGRKKVAGRKQKAVPEGQPKAARVPTGSSKLEALEHQIDECLILARYTDRDGLTDVIDLLRRARNKVVWKLGQ